LKKSTKIWLGIATIWPVVYMLLFFVAIISFMIFLPFAQQGANRNAQSIDLIQLEQKIKNNELKSLRIRGNEIVAIDRLNGEQFDAQVTNERTRNEIIRQARERDASGKPRVERIDEESDPSLPTLLPVGFIGLFVVHFFTILLVMALMAFYIVQVVRTDRLDQTMKILWTVLICMIAIGAMPVYWYLYVWREPPAATI
jgi:ATP-dependent Zn protease